MTDNQMTTKDPQKEAEQTLLEFVKSVFRGQGRNLANGDYSIEIVGNPKYLVVHLYDLKDKGAVEVYINGDLMGAFTRYTGQGYQYKFQQQYRKYIRNGRTPAEQYMEDTCMWNNDKVLLCKAYS